MPGTRSAVPPTRPARYGPGTAVLSITTGAVRPVHAAPLPARLRVGVLPGAPAASTTEAGAPGP
ncbi:hypothetical protein ACH4Q7_24780 [Streptomyces roseolus]|uniref:hypothetical protein n=1 Tax=Streptomyces roseolus TaxID=67358 RepID=UPI0037BC21F2